MLLALAQRNYRVAQEAFAAYRPKEITQAAGTVVPREWYEGLIARGLGEREKAEASFLAARARAAARVAARPEDGIALVLLAQIDARLGRKAEALREAERALELFAATGDHLQTTFHTNRIAAVYAQAGETDRALDLLEQAAKRPNGPSYGGLKLNEEWDPLRSHPRFQKIPRCARAEGRAAMTHRNFFSELKRRNVYKVAVAYAVVAWLLIQLASILFPAFEAPAWVMKVFIALVALGFPIALILAWAFELTPEGLKRTEEVPSGESIARSTGRKLDFAIIGVLALAVALLLFDRFRSKPQRSDSGEIQKSIAVLPFENLSRDPDNAYFATGVQDEILTRLAKVSDLKVISRTSTQQDQSRPGNLKEIAQQLGVAHILEGSVQRAADSVRVNVQLIKADTDAHLWAETYDGKLSEIFKVQSDIALRIASALEAKLTGRERNEIGAVPTKNEAAYEAYLRGLALDSAQTGEETEESRASLRRAVELDPNFALAWAALTKRESFRYFSKRTQEQLTRAQQAMEMALKLAPDASESHVAAASFYYYCPQDFDRALEWLTKARERAPNNAAALMLSGLVKRRQGNSMKASS